MKPSRTRTPLVAVCLAVGLCGCGQQPRQIDFQRIINTAKSKVYPALVYVKPIRETFRSGERQRTEVFGSGVIISPDGHAVTNCHVAEKAVEINCVLGDKEQVRATVVGLDPETDLALLKLQLPEGHLPLAVADFGDSDRVEAGQFVMALGSPFGFTRSISLGIISNTKRYIGFTTRHRYNLWLQTDAAINPGNSGGPLVATDGKIIGINTLGTWAEGVGFAIPSNVVRDVMQRLRVVSAETDRKKWPVKVERAYTGLQLQALKDFNTNTFTDSGSGVLIQSVEKNSPADRTGMRDGDILLSVNGHPIDGTYVENLPMIRVALADLPVEQPAKFRLARRLPGGKRVVLAKDDPRQPDAVINGNRYLTFERLDLTVTPVTRGKFEGEDFDCRRWNMTVKEITKFSNPGLFFLQPTGGVFIQGVRDEGNAEDAGLRPNDIVLQIGDQDIQAIAHVKKTYEALVADKKRPEKKVLIKIKRGAFLHWIILDWQKDYLKED